MMNRAWISVLSVLSILPSCLLGASQEKASAKNAALDYWQAFAMLRELSPEEEEILREFRKVRLDERSKNLIDKAGVVLTMLRRGGKCEYCDWQLHTEDGADTVLPHLSKARETIKLAILRARWNFHWNKATEALEDLMAGMALARYVGAHGPVISYLVQIANEILVIETVADHLLRLDKASLRTLAKRLDTLPEGGSLATAFLVERELLPAQKDNPPSESTLKAWEEMSKVAELTPQEFERKLKSIKSPEAHSGWAHANYYQAAARTKMAMLKAAIVVLLEGKERLRSIKESYLNGPFEYVELEEGFRLESNLGVIQGRDRITLTIGRGE